MAVDEGGGIDARVGCGLSDTCCTSNTIVPTMIARSTTAHHAANTCVESDVFPDAMWSRSTALAKRAPDARCS